MQPARPGLCAASPALARSQDTLGPQSESSQRRGPYPSTWLLLCLQILILHEVQTGLTCILANASSFVKDVLRCHRPRGIKHPRLCKQDHPVFWPHVGCIASKTVQVSPGFLLSSGDLRGLRATFYPAGLSLRVQVPERQKWMVPTSWPLTAPSPITARMVSFISSKEAGGKARCHILQDAAPCSLLSPFWRDFSSRIGMNL